MKQDLRDLSRRFIDKTRQVGRFEKGHPQVLLKKMSITEERTGSPVPATGDLVATKLPKRVVILVPCKWAQVL